MSDLFHYALMGFGFGVGIVVAASLVNFLSDVMDKIRGRRGFDR